MQLEKHFSPVFSFREQDRNLFLFPSFIFLEVKPRALLVAALPLKPINLLICSLVSVPLTSLGEWEEYGSHHVMSRVQKDPRHNTWQ